MLTQFQSILVTSVKKKMTLYRLPVPAMCSAVLLGVLVQDLVIDYGVAGASGRACRCAANPCGRPARGVAPPVRPCARVWAGGAKLSGPTGAATRWQALCLCLCLMLLLLLLLPPLPLLFVAGCRQRRDARRGAQRRVARRCKVLH